MRDSLAGGPPARWFVIFMILLLKPFVLICSACIFYLYREKVCVPPQAAWLFCSETNKLSPRDFSIVPRYPSGVLTTVRREGRLVIYYPHAIANKFIYYPVRSLSRLSTSRTRTVSIPHSILRSSLTRRSHLPRIFPSSLSPSFSPSLSPP